MNYKNITLKTFNVLKSASLAVGIMMNAGNAFSMESSGQAIIDKNLSKINEFLQQELPQVTFETNSDSTLNFTNVKLQSNDKFQEISAILTTTNSQKASTKNVIQLYSLHFTYTDNNEIKDMYILPYSNKLDLLKLNEIANINTFFEYIEEIFRLFERTSNKNEHAKKEFIKLLTFANEDSNNIFTLLTLQILKTEDSIDLLDKQKMLIIYIGMVLNSSILEKHLKEILNFTTTVLTVQLKAEIKNLSKLKLETNKNDMFEESVKRYQEILKNNEFKLKVCKVL